MEVKKQYKTYKKATAKTEKAPAYKPKRGPNDGSGFTVQGEGSNFGSWLIVHG